MRGWRILMVAAVVGTLAGGIARAEETSAEAPAASQPTTAPAETGAVMVRYASGATQLAALRDGVDYFVAAGLVLEDVPEGMEGLAFTRRASDRPSPVTLEAPAGATVYAIVESDKGRRAGERGVAAAHRALKAGGWERQTDLGELAVYRQRFEQARRVTLPGAGRAGIGIAAERLELPGAKGRELIKSMRGPSLRRDAEGAIELREGERVRTDQSFAPPVKFRVVARTDSTNIRLAYAADQIIFNWELDPGELRVDGGPADGRHKKGAGRVAANAWVEIGLAVTPGEMVITVDGQERWRAAGDFSRVREPLSVFTARGATIKVRSVVVEGE